MSTRVEALLCIGGHDGNADVSTVEMLCPGEESCAALAVPGMLSERSAFGAAALRPLPLDMSSACGGQALLLAGGCRGPAPLATVDVLDLPTLTWSARESLLEQRSAPCACALGEQVLVCGGFNAKPLASVEAHEGNRDVWLAGPSMAVARCSFGMAELGGALIACGGCGADGMLSSVELLDIRCKTWSPRAPLPQARSCFGVSPVDSVSFIAAGGHDGRDTLDVVNVYDVRADRWLEWQPLRIGRSAASVARANSILWAVGGYNGQQTLTNCEALRACQGDAVLEMEMKTPRTGLAVMPVCIDVPISQNRNVEACGQQARQRRIVSLSQAHTLMLYELNAAEHVIAIDTFSSQRPSGFSEVPRLDSFAPDVEAVRLLRPDAVIVSFASQLSSADLACPVIILEAPKGGQAFDEICRQLHVVAGLAGSEESAVAVEKSLRRRLATLHQAAAPLFGCSYFLELDSELYTASSSAFLGHVFSACLGLRNSADKMKEGSDTEYFPATSDDILAADPHFYIVAHTGPARAESDLQALGLSAIEHGRVLRTPVHYDQVAWSPKLLDLVDETLRRMLQRRHSSPLPPLEPENTIPYFKSLAETMRSMLSMDGLDLVMPFCIGWYNQKISELGAPLRLLPDYGHGGTCLAFIIGNTRAVWTPFSVWMRGDGSRFDLANPFDTFVRDAVERVCKCILRGVSHEVFWSCDESSDGMVAMQRVAEISGLAQLDHSVHLSVHPVYGTWVSFRAVIVCDLDGHGFAQPEPLHGLLSADEKDAAASALQKALEEHANPAKLCQELHGDGLESCERAMDVWNRWIELRDVVQLGRQYRFCAAQLDYHYTKDRRRLRASILGQGAASAAQAERQLLVAGGHDGNEDTASAELFVMDATGRLSSVGAVVPMSKPRGGSGAATFRGEVYVIGGNEGSSPSGMVEAYGRAEKWRKCAQLATPRMCPNGATDGDAVYALGGLVYDGASPVALTSTETYTPILDQWMPGPPLQIARCSAGSACLGRRIFICGGFGDLEPLASTEALDPREGRWNLKAPLRCARSCFALVAVDEYCLLACGGHMGRKASDDSYGPTKQCEVYDARKDAWRSSATLATAAVSPAATVLGGQVCVVGGFDGMVTLRLCQTLGVEALQTERMAVFNSLDLLAVPRSGPVVASI